ncbi:MAG: DUF1217 domain-containing protein [Mesorhizobium sp.]|nr:DUF1217 domain-containing protein [Mesorhizobium sp.]
MINTYASYQLITRDINQSLTRVQNQPMVQRETEYYRENIGNVKSIDEFLDDDRLFRYAMKAHGLDDMAYAKAFMRKVLEEGIDDPNSFANKLTDKRYKDFARSFNFVRHGEDATVYNAAQQTTVQNYLLQATSNGVAIDDPILKENTDYYMANIKSVRSIDDFLNDDRIYQFALRAKGFDGELPTKQVVRTMLEGGISDPDSPANRSPDERFAKLVETFNFARYGEEATTISAAQKPAVDKYMRQTLEEEAGSQNEGVRLALYFERMAPNMTSYFEILGDRAVGSVVRTILGLPDAVAQLDVDKQAALIKSRIDIEDFKDPEKLQELLARFTTMWELNNPTNSPQAMITTLFQPVQFGISADVLMTIAQMRK